MGTVITINQNNRRVLNIKRSSKKSDEAVISVNVNKQLKEDFLSQCKTLGISQKDAIELYIKAIITGQITIDVKKFLSTKNDTMEF